MSILEQAITNTDLADLIERHYPGSLAPGTSKRRVRCTWRGSQDFNARLYLAKNGRQNLRDYVTGQNLDAFGFLVHIVGMSRREAARALILEAGFNPDKLVQSVPARPKKMAIRIVRVPEFPAQLEAWAWIYRQGKTPLWKFDDPHQNKLSSKMLELLADWIAESLRPLLTGGDGNHG